MFLFSQVVLLKAKRRVQLSVCKANVVCVANKSDGEKQTQQNSSGNSSGGATTAVETHKANGVIIKQFFKLETEKIKTTYEALCDPEAVKLELEQIEADTEPDSEEDEDM